MKIKQVCFIAAAASMVSSAHASYELVLAANINTFGTSGIQRFDGNTGAYLGTFGQGVLQNPDQIAVDPSDGTCYVTDQSSSSIFAFNYSTGEYIRGYGLANALQICLLKNGHFLASSGSNLYEFTKSGTLVQIVASSGQIFSLGQAADGTIFTCDSARNVRRFNSTLSSVLGNSVIANNIYGSFAFRGSEIYASDYSNNKVVTLSLSNSPVVTGTRSLPSGYTTPLGLAMGHDDRLFVGINAPADTSKAICRYQLASGMSTPYQFGSTSTQVRGIAVVNAPEPSTWLAIGLGVIGLARRRKGVRKSS